MLKLYSDFVDYRYVVEGSVSLHNSNIMFDKICVYVEIFNLFFS